MLSSGSVSVEYMMNLLCFAQGNGHNNHLSDFEDGMKLRNYTIHSDVAAHS